MNNISKRFLIQKCNKIFLFIDKNDIFHIVFSITIRCVLTFGYLYATTKYGFFSLSFLLHLCVLLRCSHSFEQIYDKCILFLFVIESGIHIFGGISCLRTKLPMNYLFCYYSNVNKNTIKRATTAEWLI